MSVVECRGKMLSNVKKCRVLVIEEKQRTANLILTNLMKEPNKHKSGNLQTAINYIALSRLDFTIFTDSNNNNTKRS